MTAPAPVADTTEKTEIPPSEREPINSMAEKFKSMMNSIPAEAQPADTTTPAEPAQPKEPKTRADWRNLEAIKDKYRAEAAAAAAERDQLKAELQTARGPEVENLKRELEQRDLVLKQFALEKTPQFQQHFAERIQTAFSEASEAVGAESVTTLEQIFQLPPSAHRDKQIEELAESLSLSDMRRSDLFDSYKALKRTEREKQAELAKAPQNLELLRQHQAKLSLEEQTRQNQQRALLLQHVTAQIEPELVGVDATLANTIREGIQKSIHGQADTASYVDTLVSAARWKRHQTTLREKDETIAKLEAQLAEMQTAQPSLSGSASAPSNGKKELEPLGDVFRREMGKIGGNPKSKFQPA